MSVAEVHNPKWKVGLEPEPQAIAELKRLALQTIRLPTRVSSQHQGIRTIRKVCCNRPAADCAKRRSRASRILRSTSS